jgi:hypothetical protein
LRAIEIIIDNSESLAIATPPEIAEKNQRQRQQLSNRGERSGPSQGESEIGCGRVIQFRRNPSDPNETTFNCGGSLQPPYVPHLCCCCETLLNLSATRQSIISTGGTPKTVNQLAAEEESIIVKYRDEGEIRPRYLGQYVEIDRERLLQVQRQQFITYRSGPVRERGKSSKKTNFEHQHPLSDDEN